MSREEGNEDDNWKFDGCGAIELQELTPRKEEEPFQNFMGT